jgi:hypothetical protein
MRNSYKGRSLQKIDGSHAQEYAQEPQGCIEYVWREQDERGCSYY